MGGKSGGANKEADQARKDEANRQAKIRAGTDNINAIFDGGTTRQQITPTGGAFDFSKGEYYNPDGTRRTDKVTGFDNEQVFGPSTATTGQFNDAFFDNRRQAYLDYADPQLQQQYDDAGKQLTFSLDRAGLTNSSVKSQKQSALETLYNTNKQKVADDALAQETSARTAVEDARNGLITTLNATGDAQGAASSALARASALSAPTSYSPLGQLFTDFTGTLGTQAAQEKAAAASGGSYVTPYTTGLFGNTGKVTVKR